MAILIPNWTVFVTTDSEPNLIGLSPPQFLLNTYVFHVLFCPGRPIEATLLRSLYADLIIIFLPKQRIILCQQKKTPLPFQGKNE